MAKKIKYFIIFVVVIVALLIGAYQYVIKSGGRDLHSEKADFSILATTIIAEFSSNVDASSKKYIDKAIQIEGVVTEVSNKQILVEGQIVCQFDVQPKVEVGQRIIIKGRFVGFDDLMSELKLDQCYLIQ